MTTRYVSAVVFGTAEEVMNATERIYALRLLCRRYQVPQEHRTVETEFHSCLPETAVWRVRVESITGKSNP